MDKDHYAKDTEVAYDPELKREEKEPVSPSEPASGRRRAKRPSKANGGDTSAPKGTQTRRRRKAFNLSSSEWYLNRELTWLSFNERVLHEAKDERVPLLERVKFLAIVGSNLDEFFMKRIGGLKQQVGAGVHELTIDGRTPIQQIEESYEVVRNLEKDMRAAYLEIVERLREHDIVITDYVSLNDAERATLREYYRRNIFPLLTPLAMDPAHPFPFLSNLSLNLLVTLHHPDDRTEVLARVKAPVGSGAPRFLRVGEDNRFVRLEDVMANNLDHLFPGVDVER